MVDAGFGALWFTARSTLHGRRLGTTQRPKPGRGSRSSQGRSGRSGEPSAAFRY